MKIKAPTFTESMALVLLGVILGTIFTFGIQHWNEEVSREDCTIVETLFLSHHQRLSLKGNRNREISVDCSNSERYFIDEVMITEELDRELSQLEPGERIRLLIHPNSSTIMEFATEQRMILSLEDSAVLMQGQATGFLILGMFCYLMSLVGGCYSICYGIRYIKHKV